jgi:hypothetical protein
VQDLLFTDAPGEWFTRWVRNQSAENAIGARWIAEHATHFLFFVDRAELAGSNVGKARQDTLALARLLAENKRNRPIMAIWSKSDGQCNETVERPIREKLDQFFGVHKSRNLHAANPACLEVIADLLARPEISPSLRFPHLPTNSTSAFLSYAGETI